VFVRIATLNDAMLAEMLVARLESLEIPVSAAGLNHRALFGPFGAFVRIEIEVPEEHAAVARQVLAELVGAPDESEVEAERGEPKAKKPWVAFAVAWCLPVGAGHLYVERQRMALLVLAIAMAAFLASREYPSLFWGWPAAVVLDAAGAAAVARSAQRSSGERSFAGAAVFVALLGLGAFLATLFFAPQRVIGPLVRSPCAALAACDAAEAGEDDPEPISVDECAEEVTLTLLHGTASPLAVLRELRCLSTEPCPERLDCIDAWYETNPMNDEDRLRRMLFPDEPRPLPKPLQFVFPCTQAALERTFIGWLPPLDAPRPHTFQNPFTGEAYQRKTLEPTGPWPDELVIPDAPGGDEALRIRWNVIFVFAAMGEEFGLGEFDLLVPEIETPVLYPPPGQVAMLGRVPMQIVEEFAKADDRELASLYQALFRKEQMPPDAWRGLHSLAKQVTRSGESLCIYVP
jgi:hypothetical protein